jgi:hypothetical protein
MDGTNVFLLKAFANIAAHSSAGNEHSENSRLVTAVPTSNRFQSALVQRARSLLVNLKAIVRGKAPSALLASF